MQFIHQIFTKPAAGQKSTKAIPARIVAVALCATTGSLWAQAPYGMQTLQNNRDAVLAEQGSPGASTTNKPSVALKDIYSNFNDDPDFLYRGTAWVITSESSAYSKQQFVAMPFTPAADSLVRKMQLALTHYSGTNAATVSVHADAVGLPGKVLASFELTDLPPFPSCCEVMKGTIRPLLVRAGETYWVVVTVPDGVHAEWHQNSTKLTGVFAIDLGEGWKQVQGKLSAFRVLGY